MFCGRILSVLLLYPHLHHIRSDPITSLAPLHLCTEDHDMFPQLEIKHCAPTRQSFALICFVFYASLASALGPSKKVKTFLEPDKAVLGRVSALSIKNGDPTCPFPHHQLTATLIRMGSDSAPSTPHSSNTNGAHNVLEFVCSEVDAEQTQHPNVVM